MALLLVPLLARLAPTLGLLDHPGGRRLHARPVPLIGGIAVTIAALAALGIAALRGAPLTGLSWWLALGVCLMLAAGVLDDRFELPYWLKALLQAAAILPLIFLAGAKISTLGALVGGNPIPLSYAAIPFTLVCFVGYVNAVNMIDGLDGLAGGVAVVALGFLGVCAWIEGLSGLFLTAIAFAAASVAFLIYNLRTPWRSQAVVFLGDAGSMVLGLVVGWAAIRIVAQPAQPSGYGAVAPIDIAWVLALPVMDTLVVMSRRLALRRNPFSSDRLHLHHALVDVGLSPGKATAILLVLAFLYGCYGVVAALMGVPEWILFASFLCLLVAHALFVALVRRHALYLPTRLVQSDSIAP
jgi:UDP-GlcNAc:undecaprenyl-phosphate GlcNAc-1-phosphate transferase